MGGSRSRKFLALAHRLTEFLPAPPGTPPACRATNHKAVASASCKLLSLPVRGPEAGNAAGRLHLGPSCSSMRQRLSQVSPSEPSHSRCAFLPPAAVLSTASVHTILSLGLNGSAACEMWSEEFGSWGMPSGAKQYGESKGRR